MEINQDQVPITNPQIQSLATFTPSAGPSITSNNGLPPSPSPAQFLSTHASNSPMILVEQSNSIAKALDDIFQSITSIAKLQLQLRHVNADRYVDTTSIMSALVNPLNENIALFDSNLDVIEKFVTLAMAVVRRDMRRAHMISLSQMRQEASRRESTQLSQQADLAANSAIPTAQPDEPTGTNEQVKMDIEMQQNLPSEALTVDAVLENRPTGIPPMNPEGDQNSITFKDTVNTMGTHTDLSHSDTVLDPNASNVNSASQVTELHPSLDPNQTSSMVQDPSKRPITQINDNSSINETLVGSLVPGNQTPIIIDDESGPPKKKLMIDLISPSLSPVPPTNNPGAPIKIVDNQAMPALAPALPIGGTSSETTGTIPVSTVPLTRDPSLSTLPEAVAMETVNADSKSKSGSSESPDGDLFGDGSLFGSNNNSALPSPLNPLAPTPVIPPAPEPRSMLDLSSFLTNSVPSGSTSDPPPIGLPVDISDFLSNYTSETRIPENKETIGTELDEPGVSGEPASSPGLPSADPLSLFTPTPAANRQVPPGPATATNPNPTEGNLVDLQSLACPIEPSKTNWLVD
ncbi:uncharacterized protein MELLADRAFT_114922 [Melampsora larici-populina 98AG31]|uniref:Uncharacterized protein n=1 Tax=Melampsora larici-populina (strain 98AG31 / pathotype 3-4-7) TaxID=747676 RepID=F4R4F3_MELLP|nr:uncharacterized protein MELLADRAFT_114922 [Melampsora larici-populina 98AG31]EGG13011.1 hypothetical protein MELLADRAFT_114922 [Melampsora larici-populina 98AG31]